MYGHGFATLFLAEVYGSTRETTLREKLRRAVRLIVARGMHRGKDLPAELEDLVG